jgi:hypothetical protein
MKKLLYQQQFHPLKRQQRLLQYQNQHRHLHHQEVNDELVVPKVKILMNKMMNNNSNRKRRMVNQVMNPMDQSVLLIVHQLLFNQHQQHQKRKVDVQQ